MLRKSGVESSSFIQTGPRKNNILTEYVIAADEVGRGCFAGEVFVCGVRIPKTLARIAGVDDSKKLSASKRESLYPTLTKHPDIAWVLITRSVSVIDRIGIDKATTEAFIDAVTVLHSGLTIPGDTASIKIDGKPIWNRDRFPNAPTNFIVKGDATEWEIGAASIIAKVSRDKYMEALGLEHPEYNWGQNKGYGTADHISAIKRYGLTEHHRRTFCKNHTANSQDVLDFFKDMK